MIKVDIKSEHLNDFVNAIKVIGSECKLIINDAGFSTNIVDAAHVVMGKIDLSGDSFEKYDVKDELTIGLNIEKLNSILKISDKEDIIRLHIKSTDTMIVSFKNIKRTMQMLSASEIASPKIPNINYDAEFQLFGEDLQRAVRASTDIGDFIKIRANGTGIQFYTKDVVDEVQIDFPSDVIENYELKEPCSCEMSLQYFGSLIRMVPNEQEAKLEMATDKPIKIAFGFAGNNGYVTYIQAPRIRDESEE